MKITSKTRFQYINIYIYIEKVWDKILKEFIKVSDVKNPEGIHKSERS